MASFGTPVSPLMSLVYEKLSDSEREERQKQIPGATYYAEEAAESRARANAAQALDQLFGRDQGVDPTDGVVQEGRNADLPPAPNPSLFWMRGVGRVGSSQQQGDAPAVDMHGGAGFIGLDLPYDAQTRFGVAAGYSRSFLETDTDSKLEADGYHISGYATHANGPWRMRAIATYAYYDLESRREIPFGRETTQATASYSANNIEALAEVSYVATFGALAVEPYASVGVSWLDTQGFWEKVPEGAPQGWPLGCRGSHRDLALQHPRRAADDAVRACRCPGFAEPRSRLAARLWRCHAGSRLHHAGSQFRRLGHSDRRGQPRRRAWAGRRIALDRLAYLVEIYRRDRRQRPAPHLFGRPRHPVLRPRTLR